MGAGTVMAAAVLAVLMSAAPPSAVPDASAPPATTAVRPVGGEVLAGFRAPPHRFGAGHRGVDLAAAGGDAVRAARAGTIAFAGLVAGRGWVSVDHGGDLTTTYGVLSGWEVEPGQRVAAGDVLGRLDPGAGHLDWGARLADSYIDPMPLLGTWETHLVAPSRLGDQNGSGPLAPRPDRAGVSTWPVRGRVTSAFGRRRHPLTGTVGAHRGVDIAAPAGTPVVAAGDGVVTFAGMRGGYGLLVVVDHGGGIISRYAHAGSVAVEPGHRVHRGQLVARVGTTGHSTGPHLHFEVHVDGRPRDPLAFL